MLSRRRVGSTLSVLTKLRFSQPVSAPAFSPAMPPVCVRPCTVPEALQETIMPETSFLPATPPTWVSALTSPEKLQFVSMPRLSPTRPPTMLSSPRAQTLPLMCRSCISASFPVSRKKPQGDWAEERLRS